METATVIDFRMEDIISRVLVEIPDLYDSLSEMVAYEKDHTDDPSWSWQNVHTPPSVVNQLIARGIVDLSYQSRKYSCYRLHSLDATQGALEMISQSTGPKIIPLKVDELFKLVIGHERAKSLLQYAINANSAVHCLLVGPPGNAKSLMLSDIGGLPGAELYVGSTTTKSGLVGLLMQARPRILVLDEIDKMSATDMTPLLNLMESGVVTRLQHKVQERITLDTKVFAGANDVRKISPPILSRFAQIKIPAYSKPDFIEVAAAVLVQREAIGPQMAQHIAFEVAEHSLDIRDAVRVARMARGDPRLVFEVIKCLWPKSHGTVTELPRR